MTNLPFPSWVEQSNIFNLPYSDIEACSETSPVSKSLPQLSGTDSDKLGSGKMAIPRLADGADSAFTSPGRFHRRHVRRACESCRQRKTKCTGDKSGCRNCREAGIICCYTDGKREKSKRQLASLSAKVQAYEDVIRKLSSRFGVSDEQLMGIALNVEASSDINMESDDSATDSGDLKTSWNPSFELPSPSSSAGPLEAADHTEEDFNRDENARATGFIGKSSEINWLRRLSCEVSQECEDEPPNDTDITDNTGLPSPSLTPRVEVNNYLGVASSNYYIDDINIPTNDQIDTYEVPSRDTATKLFNAYLSSVHPSFPIVGISTFASQFQVFFNRPSLKPGNKWLAILNLIFAISAKYAHLNDASWKGKEDDHYLYFCRARSLSLEGQLFQHPDLQQLQVEGLTSFYLLASGHVNRSWKLVGNAVHSALSLGLHLRNVGTSTSDTSKEIRYRVWWSLYTIEHLLSVMTGRPSCIMESTCTTPLPVPFDESDFQKDEVARLVSSPSRGGPSQLARIAVNSSTSSLKASLDCDSEEAAVAAATSKKDPIASNTEYLKSLPPCMSLYFLQLTTLTSIAKRTTSKLYSPEAVRAPWASTEFAIRSLMLELDTWFMNLPTPYDFTSTQTPQCPTGQKMGLAFLFYSTKIGITRPCLCRLDGVRSQSEKAYDFCSKTAAECVESACHMLNLFPETPDTTQLYKMCPWWCMLHFLMQATTVLLLELAFDTQHVPDKASTVSKAARKALEWLSLMSKTSLASGRAWKLCNVVLRRLAPKSEAEAVAETGGDASCSGESTAVASPDGQLGAGAGAGVSVSASTSASATNAAASAVAADTLAAELDSITCSPMDETSGSPLSTCDLDTPELLGLMKPEKQDSGSGSGSSSARNFYDDFLPYDPATGQITGSFFPWETGSGSGSGSGSNTDLDLGCFWGDQLC